MQKLAARLVRRRLLVALDYDGTLAPQPRRGNDPRLPEREKRLLARLARHVHCVVISGRAFIDLKRRLSGLELDAVVGNHGCDDGQVRWRLMRQVAGWKAALLPVVRAQPGVRLEDKRYSLSVLLSTARHPARARRAVEQAAAQLDGATIFGGRQVVNVVSARAPHKGDAVSRLRWRTKATAALYVGDDVGDEDVFRLGKQGWLTGVKVGRGGRSAAKYRVRSQRQVVTLLKALVEAVEAKAKR